jgi:hypothetical protein
MSTYPTTLDTLPIANANDTPSIDTHPALHNDVNAAVMAIQSTLGVDPQGSDATVAARIAALEGGGGGGSLTRADVALTAVSQSSTYAGTTAGTTANMTDGDGTTGTGTNNGANEWIAVEWSGAKLICGARLGGGTIAGFGMTSNYQLIAATRFVLQYWDGASWKTWISQTVTATVANSGALQFVEHVGMPVLTTKLRLYSVGAADYVACTEFVPIELKLA